MLSVIKSLFQENEEEVVENQALQRLRKAAGKIQASFIQSMEWAMLKISNPRIQCNPTKRVPIVFTKSFRTRLHC